MYVVVARLSVLGALRLVGARLAVRIVVPGTGCRVQRETVATAKTIAMYAPPQRSGLRVQGSGCRVWGSG